MKIASLSLNETIEQFPKGFAQPEQNSPSKTHITCWEPAGDLSANTRVCRITVINWQEQKERKIQRKHIYNKIRYILGAEGERDFIDQSIT